MSKKIMALLLVASPAFAEFHELHVMASGSSPGRGWGCGSRLVVEDGKETELCSRTREGGAKELTKLTATRLTRSQVRVQTRVEWLEAGKHQWAELSVLALENEKARAEIAERAQDGSEVESRALEVTVGARQKP